MLDWQQGKINFKDPKFFDQIAEDTNILLLNWQIGEANDYLIKLEEMISEDEQLKEYYLEIIIKLGYFTLAFREDKEVEDLLKTKLVKALRLGVEVSWAIEQRIYSLYDNVLGWKERRRIINNLDNNAEVLGDFKLELAGPPAEPILADWFKDYNLNFDIGLPRAGFEEVSYLNKSQNARKLKKDDKDILLAALKVYDDILYPAYRESIELQVEKGRPLTFIKIKEGEDLTPLPADQKTTLKQIEKLYQANLIELQNKYQISQSLQIYKDYQLNQLKNLLFAEIKNPKIVLPVLALILEKDKSLKLLEMELADQFGVPANLKFKYKKFLNKLLLGCGLTEGEAAIYLLHLARDNKNLVGLAYADMKEMVFKLKS